MTTNVKMRVDGTGKLALYTYDTAAPDDLPFTDPLGNLSRVIQHSDLPMPAVLSVNTYTLTLPSMTPGTSRDVAHVIAAHGRTGTPMVFGRIQNGSGWIPFNGSLLLPMYPLDGSMQYRLAGYSATTGTQGPYGLRKLTLGADATNIVVHEESHCHNGGTPAYSLPIVIEVTVFDFNCDTGLPLAGLDPVAVHFGPGLITASRGRFRSDRTYIRKGGAAPTHYMPAGRTLAMGSPTAFEGVNHAGPVKFVWTLNSAPVMSFDAAQRPVTIGGEPVVADGKLLALTPGRFEIRDATGRTRFDSNERYFFATDYKTGTITRPARSTFYSRNVYGVEERINLDVTETVGLGSVHSAAEAVVGIFKVTGTAATPTGDTKSQAANGVRNYGWFAAGGTYLHAALPRWLYSTAWATYMGGLMTSYTFEAAGGALSLTERSIGNPGGTSSGTPGTISLAQEAITIDYKLFVGTYV